MKDFAWHESKKNPLWREAQKINWKRRAEIIIGIVAFLTTVGLCLFASIFKINNIQITGLNRISLHDFKNTIQATLNYRQLFILPGNNYFLVDLSEIRDILKEKYSLNSIIIKKTFPNIINITVEEKISKIIYDNGLNYSYLDENGAQIELMRKLGNEEYQVVNLEQVSVVSTTTTSTIERVFVHRPNVANLKKEFGDYPIIYDKNSYDDKASEIILDKITISGVMDWFNLIKKQDKIKVEYFIIGDERARGIVVTGDGWIIKTDFSMDSKNQFDQLQYLLKEKIDSKAPLNYIDLRYPGKVYWQ